MKILTFLTVILHVQLDVKRRTAALQFESNANMLLHETEC